MVLLVDVNSVLEASKTRNERLHFDGNNDSYANADAFILIVGVVGISDNA
jgi:hypothetical protein